MGEWLIDFYKNKIKKEHKIAFVTTFIITLLVHIYMFTNSLPSEDTLYNYYHVQNMTTSGRWALSFFCSLSSYYNLPWICGLLSTIYFSITTTLLVDMFKVKNPILIAMIGGILTTSIFMGDTFQFIFVADGYMFAMLLATLAVYLTGIEEKRTTRYVLAGVLLCLSCGIYQAYINYAMVLVICKFIEVLLENKPKKKICIDWLKKQAIMYFAAVAVYYVIWRLCLHFCDISAHSYLGISEVGKLDLDLIIGGLKRIPLIVLRFFFGIERDLFASPAFILNSLFVIFALAIIIYVCIKNKIYKRKGTLALYILSFILIIPVSTFWTFTSELLDLWRYFPRMLASLAFIYVFMMILCERYCGKLAKNLLLILMTALVFNSAVTVNIMYSRMQTIYERSYADGLEMSIRIHDVVSEYEKNNEGVEISEIVFVGSKINEEKYEMYDEKYVERTMYANAFSNLYNLKETLLFDGIHAYLFVYNNFDVKYYQNWDINVRDSYLDREDIKNMPIWPDKDSVAIVDYKVLVKIANTKETEA